MMRLLNGAIRESGRTTGALVGFVLLVVASAGVYALYRQAIARLTSQCAMNLRIRLARAVLAARLRAQEETGHDVLIAALVSDADALSMAAFALPIALGAATTIVACVGYLAWLNPIVLLVVLGGGGVSFALVDVIRKRAHPVLRQAHTKMDETVGTYRAMMLGATELKLNRSRRAAFLDKLLEPAVAAFRDVKDAGNRVHTMGEAVFRVLLFLTVAVVAFEGPRFANASAETTTGYILVVLYLMGPLKQISLQTGIMDRAEIAVLRMEELIDKLNQHGDVPDVIGGVPTQRRVQLELRGVSTSYRTDRADETFTLGPVSLELRSGEILFIVGGNGSGKTTLAKLLCGLYESTTGEIVLNGEVVTPERKQWFREHFSAVFADFYLFERLLGTEGNVDDVAVQYLKDLHLDYKVTVTDGKLSTTSLSRGQRKRLALLTCYLENRPIVVLDEWAADQDPVFREVFYRSILPRLKEEGRAVFVVSHDDQYFSVADRIIRLERGQLLPPAEGDQRAGTTPHPFETGSMIERTTFMKEITGADPAVATRTQKRRLKAGPIVALANLAVAMLCAAIVVGIYGLNPPGLYEVIRLLTKIAFFVFIVVFICRPLHDLVNNSVTSWMLANRRFLGLSYAAWHLMHWPILTTMAILVGPAKFWLLFKTWFIPWGGPILLLITFMAATSSNRAQRFLGKRLWSAIHTIGIYTIWVFFFKVYLRRLPHAKQEYTYVYLGILIGALVFRLLMAASRKWRAPRSTATT